MPMDHRPIRADYSTLAVITQGHDDYEALLDPTVDPSSIFLNEPSEYAPLALGGASQTIWTNRPTLVTRLTEHWNEEYRTNFTEREVEAILMMGIPCPSAPSVDKDSWAPFHTAVASEDTETAKRITDNLPSRLSASYFHLMNCVDLTHACRAITRRLSSMTCTFDESTQPGCINPDYDTPGHPMEGHQICADPSHRPFKEIIQLMNLQQRTKVTNEFSTPEDAATMQTLIRKMRASSERYHPSPVTDEDDDA